MIHEMGHIVTYNHLRTMIYFMDEPGAKCVNGIPHAGVPYCNENFGIGEYDPGIFAGNPWNLDLTSRPKTFTPSKYSEVGNRVDYAETFYTVVDEVYIKPGNAMLREDAKFLYDHRPQDIGKRRFVMRAIMNGTWDHIKLGME